MYRKPSSSTSVLAGLNAGKKKPKYGTKAYYDSLKPMKGLAGGHRPRSMVKRSGGVDLRPTVLGVRRFRASGGINKGPKFLGVRVFDESRFSKQRNAKR